MLEGHGSLEEQREVAQFADNSVTELGIVGHLRSFDPTTAHYQALSESATEAIELYNDGLTSKMLKIKKEQPNRSFIPLWWFATATDTIRAQLGSVLLPKGAKFFQVASTTENDDEPTALVEAMMRFHVKSARIRTQVYSDLTRACITGGVAATLDWDSRFPIGVKIRHTSISEQNIAIAGRVEELADSTVVYRQFFSKSRLIGLQNMIGQDGMPMYMNLEKVLQKEKLETMFLNEQRNIKNRQKFYRCMTYFIPDFEFNGVYSPYVIASVIGNTLIRFQELDAPPDVMPFGVMMIRPRYNEAVGPYMVGRPVAHRGIKMDKAATTYYSGGMDAFKRNIYPRMMFDKDQESQGTLTRAKFEASAPGATIPSNSPNPRHLTAIDQPDRGIYSLSALMGFNGYEFQRMTGTPAFTSGAPGSNDERVTNLSKRLQSASSDIALRDLSEQIADMYLGPYCRLLYHLVSESLRDMFYDPQSHPELLKLARDVFGPERFDRLLMSVQHVTPLIAAAIPNVNGITLRLSDYEGAMEAQEKLTKVQQAMEICVQAANNGLPVAQMVNIQELFKAAFAALDLGDNLLMPSPMITEALMQSAQEGMSENGVAPEPSNGRSMASEPGNSVTPQPSGQPY